MSTNNGKAAEKAFEAYWLGTGHVERLRDKQDLVALNNGLKGLADFSKPSDFLVSSPDHEMHYAEVKSTQHAERFAFSNIRPAQSSAALREAIRGRGAYIFYIFSYQHGQWFVMPAQQYRDLTDDGRRSVKFEELKTWQR